VLHSKYVDSREATLALFCMHLSITCMSATATSSLTMLRRRCAYTLLGSARSAASPSWSAPCRSDQGSADTGCPIKRDLDPWRTRHQPAASL